MMLAAATATPVLSVVCAPLVSVTPKHHIIIKLIETWYCSHGNGLTLVIRM